MSTLLPESTAALPPADRRTTDTASRARKYSVPDGLDMPEPPRRGVIWHFSDLHFPPNPVKLGDGRAARRQPVQVENDTPFEELFDYVSKARQWHGGFLVMSGDFVQAEKDSDMASRKRAFRQAKRFVDDLTKAMESDPNTHCIVVVCPGNHDVDFTIARGGGKDPIAAFKSTFAGYVSPGKNPSVVTGGVCMLTLDTTSLCGRMLEIPQTLESGSPTVLVQFDASLFDRGEVKRALGKLKSSAAAADVLKSIEKGEILGIVVAHHQPSLTPSVWPELKPFENPAAAAQVKQYLAGKGFQIFLHGHKHTSVAHHESTYPLNRKPADGLLVLGAPAFRSGGEDRGFNVIEYLVSPTAGETRVLLHPHAVIDTRPIPLPPRRFDLPARAAAPAAVVRLTFAINDQGDCRLDTEYVEIPLPVGQDAHEWGGWTLQDHRWVRVFERRVIGDLDVTSRPMWLHSFSPGVTVTHEVDGDAPCQRSIRVVAEARPRATHASFVEHVFMNGAFAVSRMHQARIVGTDSLIPGVEGGWEGIMHVAREPARRLEVVVELPFASEVENHVDVRAYEARDGYFVEDPSLFHFSPCHVAANASVQRLLVSVDSPIVGVAYVVRWRLPEDVPAAGGGPAQHAAHADHSAQAERCRRRAYECLNPNVATEIAELLTQHVTDALTSIPLHPSDRQSLRWSLYVPDRRLSDMRSAPRPKLVPVIASSEIGPEWRRWDAGRGVVGRAYALKRVIEEIGPTSERHRESFDDGHWSQPAIRAYEPGAGEHQYSVLYGIPLRAPDQPALTWGIFCIGTWREHSAFDLHAEIDLRAKNDGSVDTREEASTGLLILEHALEAFSIKLGSPQI